jgi:MFS family permease
MEANVQASHNGPSARLTVREQLALSSYWFSLNFQNSALMPIVIPAQILLFVAPGQTGNAQQAAAVGALSALAAVVALILQPTIGAISDYTPGRLGRRRPYVIVFSLVLVAGSLGLAFAGNGAAFLLAFIFVQIGNNGSTAAYQALIPDRVPAAQRGAASGYMGLMNILGNVGSLALAGALLSSSVSGSINVTGLAIFYILSAASILLGAIVTAAGVPEEPWQRRPTDDRHASWTARWVDPWHHANFTWVFLTRASVMFGLTLFLSFIEYYFAAVAKVPNFVQATAVIAVLALLGAVVSAFTLGIYSDRVGRVAIVCLATACMALAAVIFMVSPGGIALWPLGVLFGIGYGAYTSVDWALAVASLPSQGDAGKDMGLWSLASTVPSILAPLIGSGIITVLNAAGVLALGYRAVFALAALFLVLGAIFVLEIRDQPVHPVAEEVHAK